MKSLFENLNFLKLFFVISVTLFSSVSLSENSNTIKESIISVDDLIDTYNSSDSTNKTAIDKASIQDFISEEPYYILMDNLLVGALTDALNFIGLDMDTPSSSRPQSQNGYKEFSDASMVLIYIIKAAWGVGMLIFAFVFGKFLFRAVFEGASSGEFGSKDSPLAMWDIARLSFIALLVPTDISANSAIQVPLIVHLIIIAIAISLVLVAIFMITVANFTFLNIEIVSAPAILTNSISQDEVNELMTIEEFKEAIHKKLFKGFDKDLDDPTQITLHTIHPIRYGACRSNFSNCVTDFGFYGNTSEIPKISTNGPTPAKGYTPTKEYTKIREFSKKYLEGIRACIYKPLDEVIKNPPTPSFYITHQPTVANLNSLKLYKESSLSGTNFNPESKDVLTVRIANNANSLMSATDFIKNARTCLSNNTNSNPTNNPDLGVSGPMTLLEKDINAFLGVFHWPSTDNIIYAFIRGNMHKITKIVDRSISDDYHEFLRNGRIPTTRFTFHGTIEQLKSYGVLKKDNIYVLENFAPDNQSNLYSPPDGFNFYNSNNVEALSADKKYNKFVDIIGKMLTMDKSAYQKSIDLNSDKSLNAKIYSQSICDTNSDIFAVSQKLKEGSPEMLKETPLKGKSMDLCKSLDQIISASIDKSPPVVDGPCANANNQKACQASRAPIHSMSPTAEGSTSNSVIFANDALVLSRAVTKSTMMMSGFNSTFHKYNNHYSSLDPTVEKLQNIARVPLFVTITYKATIFAMFLFAMFILLANTVKNIVIAPMWAASLTKQSQQEGVAGDQLHGFKEMLYIVLYPSILLISIMTTFFAMSFIISVLYEMIILNDQFLATHQLQHFLSFLPGSSFFASAISKVSELMAYLVFYVLMFLITIRTFKWMFIMPYKIMKSVGISTNQMNKNMMKEMMSVSK